MQVLALIAALAAPLQPPARPLPPEALAQVTASGQPQALRLELTARAGADRPFDLQALPPSIRTLSASSDPGSVSQAATTLAFSLVLAR